MANNVPMKDAGDDTRVFATIEVDGVHYPVHVFTSAGAFSAASIASALTTGSSASVQVGIGNALRPGLYQMTVWGTAGTSTLKLQFSPDSGTTWIDTDITDIAQNSVIGVHLAAGHYRVTVVTPGGGSSWSADFRGI